MRLLIELLLAFAFRRFWAKRMMLTPREMLHQIGLSPGEIDDILAGRHVR